MKYLGDITLDDTLDFKFTTADPSTGAPTTLSGTPAISIYEDNGTTEITAGVTLTADFDTRTGLNHVRIAATAANGFEVGKNYQAVITTGTVGGTSAVGYVVAEFSIENRSGADVVKINGATSSAQRLERSTKCIGLVTVGVGSNTTSVIASSIDPGSIGNDQFQGRLLSFAENTGTAALRGQSTPITAFNHTTQTFTVTALTAAPQSGDIAAIT